MQPVRPEAVPTVHRLENGLEILLHQDRHLPLVALHLTYRVGSRHESEGQTGLAHLFEHMLFQGSENVSKNGHFELIQQAGGVANGSTGKDRTSYYETVPQHHLELALWLESDRMGSLLPALTQEKLENQRQVVVNERLQRVDNRPYGRCFERLFELLYPLPHPYHWPVIGYSEDLERATLADLQSFFTTFYRPANAVLALAGDIDPASAPELIDRYFGDIPAAPRSGAAPGAAPGPPLDLVAGPVEEVMGDRVELPRVYLAYPAPAFGGDGWRTADLLTTLLGSGKSSPLYSDLVYSRQLAKDVSAFVVPGELASTFVVVATATTEAEVGELRRRLLEHVERIRDTALSDGDLERARNRVITAWHSGLQGLDRRAELMALYQIAVGDPSRPFSEAARYLEIEADDLQRLARQSLADKRRVILTVVPERDRG